MLTDKILVTVKTYPNISSRYVETVCTGGITEQGEWCRLYPIPFRYLSPTQRYKLFDVISVQVSEGKDGRPETRRPHNPSLRVVKHIADWQARREWVEPTAFPSLAAMVQAGRTLAPVRVREVLEFHADPVDPDWTEAEKELLRQEGLFEKRQPLEKIPFEFRFTWRDGDGALHERTRFLAWEVCETWRQYRQRYDDPTSKMRDKWMQDLCGPGRDVLFFMGNLAKFRQHYMICGIFSPPKETKTRGTLWGHSG